MIPQLRTFIQYGTEYLTKISHQDIQYDSHFVGRFTYQTYMNEPLDSTRNYDIHPQDDYNLLRHNGAIYSLALSYEWAGSFISYGVLPTQQLFDIVSTMQYAVQYLKHNILPVPMGAAATLKAGTRKYRPNELAPWERVDDNDPNSPPRTAKLGGAGLTLIALVSMERIVPGTTTMDYLRQIGNFILNLQKPDDGSFYCKYFYKTGAADDSWTSLYYPGEAALGLVLLAELEEPKSMLQQQWLTVSTKALLYLERLRRNEDPNNIEPDHWALLATARVLPLLDEATDEYWLVYSHGVKVAHSMIVSHTHQGLIDHGGCFTYDRRTCPTATRLEGLCE
jgi:hypothetical protein